MAEPKFKVGDRVEVDLCANTSQTARWARTTITSVHTPKTDPISGIIYRTTKGTYQEKDVRAPQEEGNG